MIPWIYHRLTARDMGVDLLRIFHTRIASSGAFATLTATFAVPAERTLLVNQWHVFGAGGGGQTFDRNTFTLRDPTGTDIVAEMNRVPTGQSSVVANVLAWDALEGSPALIVPPNTNMTVTAFFSAGAAANAITVSISGLLVPHGTFSA